LRRRHITVLLSGITPAHEQILTTLGIAAELRRDGHIFTDTPAAIAFARSEILHIGQVRERHSSMP
jgi:SulP family sulfate permease